MSYSPRAHFPSAEAQSQKACFHQENLRQNAGNKAELLRSSLETAVDNLQAMAEPELRTSFVGTPPFHDSEIIVSQLEDDALSHSQQDTIVSATPEALESLLRQFGTSDATHVVALSDSQVQRLFTLSGSDPHSRSASNKPQVFHMVTVEDSTNHQALSVPLEDHSLSIVGETEFVDAHQLSTTSVPVSPEPQVLSVPPDTNNFSLSPLVSNHQRDTLTSQSQAVVPDTQETSKISILPISDVQTSTDSAIAEVAPSIQDSANINSLALHVVSDDSCHLMAKVTEEQEVVKKTMVEAYVKMVVCRKVTIQKVNQKTGQVIDTEVKLEEEEPVILGVDCVETTEDVLSSDVSNSKKDADLGGGLKFLSAVSENRQKIGKSLLANALLKSTLENKGVSKLVSEDRNIKASEKVPDSKTSEEKVEVKTVSDTEEWIDDACNDESEDYVPGRQTLKKSASKCKRKTNSNPQLLKNQNVPSHSKTDIIVQNVSHKKRGRKRKWDNALGIASNLKSCQFCSKRFKTTEACAKHMKRGKCLSPLVCFLCSKTFVNEEELNTHLISHEDKSRLGKFECNDCKRTYRTRAGYFKHFKMGTCLKRNEFEDGKLGEFSCNICSSQFSTEAYLKLHKYKVHENPANKHTCPDCGKKFYSKAGFNKHRSGRPCTDPLECKICGKTYSSKAKENFKMHMRQHKTEATGVMFECDECDRSYMTQVALNKHKLSHSGVKPYKCEICGKLFPMRYMVKDHARTHTGERPYACTLCGSAFSNRGHLCRHMRSHENGTLLKRGRPKKIRGSVERPLGIKVVELSPALQQQLDGQAIQMVNRHLLETQTGSAAPMIIRTDNNTIIITDAWPASTGHNGVSEPAKVVLPEQSTLQGSGIASLAPDTSQIKSPSTVSSSISICVKTENN